MMQRPMQQRCSTHCVQATLILLLAIVGPLRADLNLMVHFMMYKSSQHTRIDGYCCDPLEDDNVCSECDNQFLFCLRPSGVHRNAVLSRDDESCPFGSFKTGNISGDNTTFESGQDLDSGVPNPMSFNFKLQAWPSTVELYVRVDDVDFSNQLYDGDDMVAQFDIPIVIGGNVSHSQSTLYHDRLFHGVSVIVAFELSCVENFYGDDCSTFCIPRDDELGHYNCGENGLIECLDGFQDTTENCTVCTLSEGCSSENGYCNDTNHCVCKESYTGNFCEIDLDPCGHEAPCLHNGNCSNNETIQGGYVCSCSDEYTGTNCELDLNLCQHEEPCKNNASCSNTNPNNYTCECPSGYEGKDCEFEMNECDLMPCRNGATCQDHHLQYSCLCVVGFTGSTCEIDINECDPNPCINGELCLNMIGMYECVCNDKFSGKDCQAEATVAQRSHFDYAPIIGGVATTAVLMCIILLLMLVLLHLLKQRRKLKISTVTSQQITGAPNFRVHNPTYREFDADSNETEDNNESKAIEHRFDNPIYDQSTQLDLPEGEYNRLDLRMGSITNFHRGVVELSPHYSRINNASFVPLHKHHQYEYIDRGDSQSSSGGSNPHDHQYDYADSTKTKHGVDIVTLFESNHYDQAEGAEVSQNRPVHHYEDIDQAKAEESGVNMITKPHNYDHLQTFKDEETSNMPWSDVQDVTIQKRQMP